MESGGAVQPALVKTAADELGFRPVGVVVTHTVTAGADDEHEMAGAFERHIHLFGRIAPLHQPAVEELLPVELHLEDDGAVLGVLVFMSGIFPALRASRANPIESLRYE